MTKDPAFLFYSSDFLTGTMIMSDQDVGQYIRLLCYQHQHGHFDANVMQSLCHGNASTSILSKFKIDENGLYYNERLEIEVIKRKKHSEKQRENANKRWQSNGNATAMPLENEIENEVENKIEKRKGGKGGNQKPNLLTPESVSATIPANWDKAEFEILLLKWAAKRKKKPDTDLAILRVGELAERHPYWNDARRAMTEAAAEGWMKFVYANQKDPLPVGGRYAHERNLKFDKA